MNKFRKFLYWFAKILGDVNAIRRGKIGRRIARRATGKATGRMMGGKSLNRGERMRQIKFRAWDKDGMYADEMIYNAEEEVSFQKWIKTYSMAVMQYTGVKDKNGTEIYESDIYKNPNGVIYNVYWDWDVVGFLAQPINRINEPAVFLKHYNRELRGEVIGNIYEHPHLLERVEE